MYEKRILWKFSEVWEFNSSKVYQRSLCKKSSNSQNLYEKRILAKFQKFENLVLQILQNFISLRNYSKEIKLWEREGERGVCVCVEPSVFASWLLKIPSATIITKACFGGKNDPKSPHYEERKLEFAIFWQNVVAYHKNITQFLNFFTFVSDL